MKKPLHLLCLLLLLLTLSACKKERLLQKLPDEIREWIKVNHNDKIAFTSTTGEQEELTVTINNDVIKRHYGDYEWLILTFSGRQEQLGFKIQADKRFLDFVNITNQDFEIDYLTLNTDATPGKEYLTPFGVTGELRDNQTLNSKQYSRILFVEFYKQNSTSGKITELYYARTEGLVAFKTVDGNMWHRTF